MDRRHWILMEWKDCEIELPPKDGHYTVKNKRNSAIGICFYDGFGFKSEGKYYEPDSWREIITKEKRYGKIKQVLKNCGDQKGHNDNQNDRESCE